MTITNAIKPTHRAIKRYYETLGRIHAQGVDHESATRPAFQTLLFDLAKARDWDVLTELGAKHAGNRIIPDATIRDVNFLPRGYWEAKDTKDDLDAEIAKKIAHGYPTTNIIFEDTRQGVLYQDGDEVLRANLGQPQELADLLNRFFTHTEPDIDKFETAVEEFRERVPDLAKGLTHKLDEAHKSNPKFQTAFADFFRLCQHSLNPNISRAAVDEMLVQHLLTERLIRTIFDNEEFTSRNVIAAEVEKVISALVSKSFNRREFLKSLDRFYVAIEGAARGLSDFSEKQHFLNTVYERFFQGYSIKVADTHGIVYTPQPIVDFMCASVAEVLEKEFGKTLGSKDVNILDPCTGTGNFIVNILRRIPKRDVKRMYRDQLFANEVMLLPYYIAALNIEHAHFEITGEYESFEGLCFVDTLDMAEHAQSEFGFMTQKNTIRVEKQKQAPITVIIGNPPYNMGQDNENDSNKNRKYPVVDRRINQTYARDSRATLNNKLYDPYVKFFRWATDRLDGRDGIVCFVSNNSFFDQIAFDGMRKNLIQDFSRIYHIDLRGNVRKNPKISGTTHNVFGIKVGVGITLAVRHQSGDQKELHYYDVSDSFRRDEKLSWLSKQLSIRNVAWSSLSTDEKGTWLVPANADRYESLVPLGNKDVKSGRKKPENCVFVKYSLGVATNRDSFVFGDSIAELESRMRIAIEVYNKCADTVRSRGVQILESDLIDSTDQRIKWTRQTKNALTKGTLSAYDQRFVRQAAYRPFKKRWLYFDDFWNEERYQQHLFLPGSAIDNANKMIVVSAIGFRAISLNALMVTVVPELHLCAASDGHQCFPYYLYDEDGSNRRENITDWALKQSRAQYGDQKITKWDIFYYVYGVLHHPGYRNKYADNLKRELPRIPFAPDFWAFSTAGKELAHWHLDYEQIEPFELTYIETNGVPLSYRVEDKMRLSKDKADLTINKSLTVTGIPKKCFDYRLGNRSALEWVIDQYQVKKDARTGIVSDPNRPDDPEYVVRLVGQVIRVSLETVRIINDFPEGFGG